jgi:hypothetical protein
MQGDLILLVLKFTVSATLDRFASDGKAAKSGLKFARPTVNPPKPPDPV